MGNKIEYSDEIEYSIVALGLSSTEVAAIIEDATGVTVDPTVDNFLQALDVPQAEAAWKRLSEHPGWSHTKRQHSQFRAKDGVSQKPVPPTDSPLRADDVPTTSPRGHRCEPAA